MLAYEAGVQGIVLSNHGGRQLDTARSGIEVLVEVVSALRLRGYFPDPKFEIYVDGGVRRASDVLKAIALGATAVGVGRPFLYAFCAYGQEGVEKAIQIFRDEFEMNMRLLGARTIREVVPEMVDASSLKSHFVMTPEDNLFNNTCASYRPLLSGDGVALLMVGIRYRPATRPRAVQGSQVEDVDLILPVVVLIGFSLARVSEYVYHYLEPLSCYLPPYHCNLASLHSLSSVGHRTRRLK